MSDISPIQSSSGISRRAPVGSRRESAGGGGEVTPSEDRMEISDAGQALSEVSFDADIRVDKVMVIRDALANGTYETDKKLGVVADRLLEVLIRRI